MSIGPALPQHLQNLREQEESDSDSDGVVGPSLPAVACRGPAPPPPSHAVGGTVADDDGDSSSSDDYGPQLPPQLSNRLSNADNGSDDDDDDDVTIGPLPPVPGQELSSAELQAREIEFRAHKMKEKMEGKDSKELKREGWMLSLPEKQAKNFGLGPRTFSKKGITETGGDRSGWTDTPEDKARKARGELPEEPEEDEKDVLDSLLVRQRDEAMEEATKKLKEKRGSDSLMEIHEKKRKKKEKKEKKSKKDKEVRRPFDRDLDLQANRFDDAQRKLMIKKAAQLDSRFSSGGQKFL